MKKYSLPLLFLSLLGSPFSISADESIPMISFDDLYHSGSADFSRKLLDLEGSTVTFRGFMAPPLKMDSDFFILTRTPLSVCPFCDNEVDWPRNILYVEMKSYFVPVKFSKVIEVRGILELGTKTDEDTGFVSRIRLVNSEFN